MIDPDNVNFQDFLNKAITKLSQMDGKVVGEQMRSGRTELSEDEKAAWIKMLADKTKEGEPLDLSQVPEKYNITEDDVYRKIAQDEVRRIFD
jgi:hypothetical protein